MFGYSLSRGTAFALWLTALATPALAVQPDLVACRWPNTGLVIPAVECEAMREYQAKQMKEQAERDAQDARFKAQMEADERERAERYMAADVRAARAKAAYEASRAEEAKRMAEYRAAQDREQARYDKQQAAAVKATEATRQRCGADYRVVKVGMPFSRVQQCAGPFRMTAEINRADGVVTTYQGSGRYVHVMSGQVVAWGNF